MRGCFRKEKISTLGTKNNYCKKNLCSCITVCYVLTRAFDSLLVAAMNFSACGRNLAMGNCTVVCQIAFNLLLTVNAFTLFQDRAGSSSSCHDQHASLFLFFGTTSGKCNHIDERNKLKFAVSYFFLLTKCKHVR